MATIVVYDPSSPVVAGRVTMYIPSGNTPQYSGNANTLINPNLTAVSGVSRNYWKEDSGSIVEMSQGEKDSIDEALSMGRQYQTDSTNRQTAGTDWVTIHSLTTAYLSANSCVRLDWKVSHRTSLWYGYCVVRLRLDNTTTLAQETPSAFMIYLSGQTLDGFPKDGIPYYGWHIEEGLAAGQHTFDLQIASTYGKNPVTLYQTALTLENI